MRRIAAPTAVLAGVLLAAAGCGGGKPSTSASTSGLPTPVSVGPAELPPGEASAAAREAAGAVLSDDPPGAVACARLGEVMAAGTLMVPGVADGIVQASRGADAPLADAAERLGAAYRTAAAAKDEPDEPDKIAAVGAAASDMSGVCAESGFQAVG